MSFDLIRNNKGFRMELAAVKAGKGSHAYLIDGSEGVGKMSYALALSCAYFCKSENKPCFNCAGCKKALDAVHPDVHIIQPDKNLLTVDTIRSIVSAVYETPYEGGAKLYIVNGFHKANSQAQNAFLKTLEEPPRAVTFFLLTENYYAALDTVRSRCKRVHLNGYSEEEIVSQLEKIFPGNGNIPFAAKSSGGIIGKAIKIIEDDEAMRITRIAEGIASEINGGASAVGLALKLDAEKDNLAPLLLSLEDCFITLFKRDNSVFWMERIKAVRDAIDRKNKNVNNGLIIDELAYFLAKGGIKWQR